jgi:hypothetical protein
MYKGVYWVVIRVIHLPGIRKTAIELYRWFSTADSYNRSHPDYCIDGLHKLAHYN